MSGEAEPLAKKEAIVGMFVCGMMLARQELCLSSPTKIASFQLHGQCIVNFPRLDLHFF